MISGKIFLIFQYQTLTSMFICCQESTFNFPEISRNLIKLLNLVSQQPNEAKETGP